MAKPNYFEALNDVAAPVRGGEQSGFAASAATGAAVVAGIEKTTDAVKFLGTTALEATVGYKQAGLQKEIDDTLNNTVAGSYVGRDVKDKMNVFNAKQADAMAQLKGKYVVDSKANEAIVDNVAFEAADAAVLNEYNAEVAKLRAGQLQGVFSRDQAINRIAALVKSYSADVPGLAQSFRQIAAEQTGVSNIDVLGVHNALTKQVAADKQALARANAQLDLDKAIASANGVALDAITPAMRNNWTSEKQGERALAQLDTRLKSQGLVDTEVDKVHTQVATIKTMQAVGNIDKGFRTLLDTLPGATMEDKLKSDASGIALESLIATEYTKLVQSVRTQTLRSADNPQPLRDDTKVIAGINTQFDEIRKMVKSAEGRQMFGQLVKAQEGQVSSLTNTFLIANPGIARLNQLGLKDSFAQVFAAQGFDYDKMKAQFGEGIANTMRQAINDSTGFQRVMTDAAKDPDKLAKGVGASKETIAAGITNSKLTVLQYARLGTELTDSNRAHMANLTASWGVGFNAASMPALNEYYNHITSPKSDKYYAQFTPAERQLARRNFLVNIDKAIPTEVVNYGNIKKEWEAKALGLLQATIPDKTLDARPVVSVVQDGYLAGKLKVDVQWVGKDKDKVIAMKVGVPDTSVFNETIDKMNKYAIIYSRSAMDVTGKPYSDTQAYGVAASMINNPEKPIRFYPTVNATTPVPKNAAVSPDPTLAQAQLGSQARQPERDLAAAQLRAGEATKEQLTADINAIKQELTNKNLNGTAKRILQDELKQIEAALALK